ncbi:MAG: hypothetical protein CL484_07000 [Acidobacteria bacterium]|nr:hypothetical protein [Acidobacteriota bacterium]
MTRCRLELSGVLVILVGFGLGCGAVVEPDSVVGNPGVPKPVFDQASRPDTIQLVADAVSLPPLTLQTLDGRTLTSDDFRGKVTLVNFWATWCGPCRAEIPDLIKLQERYATQLQVIGVSTDEGPTQVVEDFSTQFGINYPVVMSTPELNQAFPGVMALPTSFIVDPDGRVVRTHVGLVSPGILEQETRFLAEIDPNITVDLVENDRHALLVNAAHATEIPGLDLATLTPTQRVTALQRLNEELCNCGCQLTLAQCRINDSACGFSLPLAEEVVAEVASL